ncbi:MAG: putative D-alanyl-D-alaninecarboxypeptidase/D-alanyl-D-alanine- endopeptidase [Candidatus Scalindua rubra]|uniref:Putative D-alanyl-D-alaninecarboxypeptidase/D-alanyl-D-alanine-endopeptidase n=1 Tax=Candidatus Scalindua rubra TaxID=1872076 RepID=A0A1E3X496_9BACT|nr:MAG: putative D-alanyl-D-alaninecarboxypeptidase/D-alanyl-D-alanine- endopeptidase [Candidatus Scalindua rubra]
MKLIPGTNQTRYKIPYFFIIALIFSYIVCLESIWSAPKEKTLRDEINAILQKYKPKGTHVGISTFSISKNKSLYKLNPNEPFVVASNMKLFTTATALVYLGAGFEYKTKIFYRGNISTDGKLDGDIIIKGSGDPNISGRFYEGKISAIPTYWADAIKKHGIKVITGDIIADDSIFDREYIRDSWPKDQLSEWYCAPVSGLSFNDNCIDIVVRPSKKPGGLAYIQFKPETSYVNIINKCKTTTFKSKHSYSFHRKPLTNQIYIKGNIWSKTKPHKEWITIHNPPLYMATVFKEILESKDIRIMGKARVINESELNINSQLHKLLVTTSSLRQAIKVTNKRSQGFYAEQILKTLGATIKNEGTFSAGLDVISNFISKLGFSEDQYQIDDGSGLSKKNKLTPVMITRLLRYMYRHKCAGVFLKSLPISGTDGTLKKRLKKEPYKSRIKAKTGYVRGVSALSGYVKTLNEEIIAFSILVNEIKGGTWQAKRLQDAICRFLVTCN